MKYQTLFYQKKTMKKYSRLSSAAVVIGALRVKLVFTTDRTSDHGGEVLINIVGMTDR